MTNEDKNNTNEEREENHESNSAIDMADKLLKGMEKENNKREELIKREENLHAKKMLGGATSAGQEQEKPKEETAVEYKDRIMRGEE